MHSVPAFSLEPEFSRSHGSLYKSLAEGQIDVDALRRLLVAHAPADWPLVFAVDASTWARCDAECSPERGFHYSASHHSAGQPIVAGWSYQWISQLNWAKDSWTAPVDVARIAPAMDSTGATINQVRRPCGLLVADREVPLFVFDAGDDGIALAEELQGERCEVLVRISSSRVFHHDPAVREDSARRRPARHGKRFVLADEGTWTPPDDELVLADPSYGAVRVPGLVRSAPEAPRAGSAQGGRRAADRTRHRHPRRRRAPPETLWPGGQETVALVVRTRRGGPRTMLSCLPAAL